MPAPPAFLAPVVAPLPAEGQSMRGYAGELGVALNEANGRLAAGRAWAEGLGETP